MVIKLSYDLCIKTPVYGGNPNGIMISQQSSISKGDTANSHKLEIYNHTGTHIDFPYHFDNSGKTSSDYSEDFWYFENVGFVKCDVEDLPAEIQNLSPEIEILILKTGFGKYRGSDKYLFKQPVIPANYAKILKERFPKLRVFGFDMVSLTSKLNREEGKKAHLSFLIENDVLILEDMNLKKLNTRPESLLISPWQFLDVDAVPCSVSAYF